MSLEVICLVVRGGLLVVSLDNWEEWADSWVM